MNPQERSEARDPAYDLLVLGGGPAGRGAALAAAEAGRRVGLVRPAHLAGAPVSGMVASNVLHAAISDAAGVVQRGMYGDAFRLRESLRLEDLRWRASHVSQQQATTEHAQLAAAGVTVVDGVARFRGPDEIEVVDDVESLRLRATHVVVAVGARPARPSGVEFDASSVVAADDVLALAEIPARLTIVGAGVVGLELASMFAALGSRVTVLEQRDTLGPIADDEVFDAFLSHLAGMHVELRTAAHAVAVTRKDQGTVFTHVDHGPPVPARAVIWAAGMQPATDALGLAGAGLSAQEGGGLAHDGVRTAQPHVAVAGAATGRWQLASDALAEGRRAAAMLLGLAPDAGTWPVPYALHAIPELAGVGMGQAELEERGIPFVSGVARAGDSLRGQIAGDVHGVLKLLAARDDGRLLGAHAFGTASTETIHVAQAVIGLGGRVEDLAAAACNHPSFCEAYGMAARAARAGLARRPSAAPATA